jgi:hypothetical protein
MTKFKTTGVSYAALRKECLDTVRQWSGCESVAGIQVLRSNAPGRFSIRITLYGKADAKIADRAMVCVQREKRRHFHLSEKRSAAKGTLVGVRLQSDQIMATDAWAAKQEPPVTRPEAIRRLVDLGLTVKRAARSVSKPGRRLRAQELATKAIDKMIDPSAPPEERAQRRRRLTKGPEEFQELRVDRPKK